MWRGAQLLSMLAPVGNSQQARFNRHCAAAAEWLSVTVAQLEVTDIVFGWVAVGDAFLALHRGFVAVTILDEVCELLHAAGVRRRDDRLDAQCVAPCSGTNRPRKATKTKTQNASARTQAPCCRQGRGGVGSES
jgi:hypothetical protein